LNAIIKTMGVLSTLCNTFMLVERLSV